MPLVHAKCTNCGANLQVDSTKDAAICSYCGSAYIVEKAIYNYNITNHNAIQADVVNIYGGNSADFVIRGGVLEKYNGASTEVVIPDTVTHIGGSAFEDCRGVKSIVIPDSVTEILDGNYNFKGAFGNCTSLTSVTIPNSVTSIGNGTFSGCTSLTSITIPNSVKSIGSYAFRGCTSLASITIPNSVKSIGDWAFSDCTSLTSFTIPNSVTSIGGGAFSDCTSLTSITIPDSVLSLSSFDSSPKLLNISWKYLPDCIDAFPARKNYLIQNQRCLYCGGNFSLFKKCKSCGRPKNY